MVLAELQVNPDVRCPVSDRAPSLRARPHGGHRVRGGEPIGFIKENVTWGAARARAEFLILGAKAHAALDGRDAVSTADIKAIAKRDAPPPHRDQLHGPGRGHHLGCCRPWSVLGRRGGRSSAVGAGAAPA